MPVVRRRADAQWRQPRAASVARWLVALAAPPLPPRGQAQYPTRPPAPAPLRPVRFPPFVTARLPNGMDLIVVEQHKQPVVTVTLALPGGAIYEPADKVGLVRPRGRAAHQGHREPHRRPDRRAGRRRRREHLRRRGQRLPAHLVLGAGGEPAAGPERHRRRGAALHLPRHRGRAGPDAGAVGAAAGAVAAGVHRRPHLPPRGVRRAPVRAQRHARARCGPSRARTSSRSSTSA